MTAPVAPTKRGPRAAASYRLNRAPLPKQHRRALRRQRMATHPAEPMGKLYASKGTCESARRVRQAARDGAVA